MKIFLDILFSIKGVDISCLPYSMSIYLPLHTKVVNIACIFNIIIFHCIQIYLWLYHCKGGISCLDMVSYLLTVAQTKMSVYADFVQNLLVHFLSLDCKGVYLLVHFLSLDCKGVYLSCMRVEDLENKSSIVKGYILLV